MPKFNVVSKSEINVFFWLFVKQQGFLQIHVTFFFYLSVFIFSLNFYLREEKKITPFICNIPKR